MQSQFLEWMQYQSSREDAIGSLARHLLLEPRAAGLATHGAVRQYLQEHGAAADLMPTFEEATVAFDRERHTMHTWRNSIALACAHCDKLLTADEYAMLNLAWPYAKGIKGGGPFVLLHKLCTHAYERRHAFLGMEELQNIFNPKRYDYKSFLTVGMYVPLLTLFRPKQPPVRLKFGKDVWVGDSNRLVLLPPEEKGEKSSVAQLPPARQRKEPKRLGWLALRFRILKRDDYRCRLCGVSAKDGDHVRLEVDHITARDKGGTNDPTNLWTLCFECNRGKGTQDL